MQEERDVNEEELKNNKVVLNTNDMAQNAIIRRFGGVFGQIKSERVPAGIKNSAGFEN